MDECTKGVKNEQRIVALERDMGDVRSDVREIKDRLLGRPTWTTTAIITILTAISCSSITFAVTALKMVIK